MPRRAITGFSNPTVKFLRSLRDKKHRRAEKRFLAEGLRLLTDARASGLLPQMLVMAAGRDAHPLLAALESEVAAAGGDIVEMDEAVLAKVTGKDNPQAVCGVFAEFDTRLAANRPRRRADLAGGAGAARSRQPRHPAAHRRRGRRGRADPDRRLRRSILGRSRARQHGRRVHPEDRPGEMAGIHRLAAAGQRASWSRPRCAMRSPTATRHTRRRASSWSATNCKACPRPTRQPATCASLCRCWAAPTASTPPSPPRCWPTKRSRICGRSAQEHARCETVGAWFAVASSRCSPQPRPRRLHRGQWRQRQACQQRLADDIGRWQRRAIGQRPARLRRAPAERHRRVQHDRRDLARRARQAVCRAARSRPRCIAPRPG